MPAESEGGLCDSAMDCAAHGELHMTATPFVPPTPLTCVCTSATVCMALQNAWRIVRCKPRRGGRSSVQSFARESKRMAKVLCMCDTASIAIDIQQRHCSHTRAYTAARTVLLAHAQQLVHSDGRAQRTHSNCAALTRERSSQCRAHRSAATGHTCTTASHNPHHHRKPFPS